ncbi:papain family cysteine protease (macronuclear) [Tetrahymena thermophila SB210]|uniref:Papain family cysteine protease n=1 Tax=Tetrahymena thermophila (strain SB210) TaxID=312017 RepID=Q236Z9_TETTS|nr:papain family cysteine protease [Tetrahymena thermophila SB210]EAR92351.1 papain family cysteine protease [Tetrahymena thermophila SB210]|eukprot:XP_001012596.1 papain family cysteine protease [Tetrahymena thermophila SB210]
MKHTALILSASFLLIALTGFATYEIFRFKHQKYHDRLKQIAEKVNNSNTTWKAGENIKWINSDIAGVKAHMGTLLNQKSGVKLEKVNRQANNLPSEFDSRVQWGDKCSSLWEVRDQSNCGSCWAFGAAESLSDRHCIHLGQDIRLSTQNLVTCCDECGFGCDGGWPEAAMDYYVNNGLVTGDLYGNNSWCQAYSLAPCAHHVTSDVYPPCTGELPTPPCVKSCDSNSTYTIPYPKDLHKGSKAYSIDQNEQAIMTEIQTNGPIEVAFTVYEDFLTYKSGVYQHVTGSELGGHAVKMVGWGVENGTPYWIIVNSWNESWGDKGTFKILRGQNECGIESECVTALPAY